MPSWDELLGSGSVAEQFLLWGVAYQVAQILLGPTEELARQQLYEAQPVNVLSPAQLADMVVKTIVDQGDATDEAQKSGLNAARFEQMVLATGEPPGLEFVLQAFRRGFISFEDLNVQVPSVERAVKTSRVYNYWLPIIQDMLSVPLSPGDAVDAVLRNQIDQAAGENIAFANGLDAANFQIALNTKGNPPGLSELLDLANRQIIPWGNLDPAARVADPNAISFAQGVYEGNNKDKWLPYLAELGVYRPPPRTVPTLLRAGVITVEQATQYLEDYGLPPALADAYIAEATHAKTTTAKNLNESSVVELYTDKLIPEAEAVTLLENLGYDANEAALIIATADTKAAATALRANVTKIGSYYIGRKISQATAQTLLNNLGVAPAQATTLLAGWDIDRTGNVKILTAAQIESAVEATIYTVDEGLTELEGLGYTPFDAWTLLSIKAKQPLPNRPAQGPPPVQ
jgi:hypothetical protein